MLPGLPQIQAKTGAVVITRYILATSVLSFGMDVVSILGMVILRSVEA